MFSLDTDTVTLALRGHPAITRRIEAANPAELSVCTIVVEEIGGGQISQTNTLRSRRRSIERESRFLADLIRSLATLHILPYTDEAEQLYQVLDSQTKAGRSERLPHRGKRPSCRVHGCHLQRQRLFDDPRRRLGRLEPALRRRDETPPGSARRFFCRPLTCLFFLGILHLETGGN